MNRKGENSWKAYLEMLFGSWAELDWTWMEQGVVSDLGDDVFLYLRCFQQSSDICRVGALAQTRWQRTHSHEEDVVKISRAIECFCSHAVRIQQPGETTGQPKFLSLSHGLTCAAPFCQSFLLSCFGSTIIYLEENWGFVSVLLKILQPLKSCMYPESELWLWAAGKKTEEGRGNRNPCLLDFA